MNYAAIIAVRRMTLDVCSEITYILHMKKFYQEIECDHGWTDHKGFAHCDLGNGCSVGFECFCTKEDCPIYEEDSNILDDENRVDFAC